MFKNKHTKAELTLLIYASNSIVSTFKSVKTINSFCLDFFFHQK